MFARWLAGVEGAMPDPRLVGLYWRAQVCQVFPAYKLHELRDLPAGDIMQAMQLLDIARQVQEAKR